MKTFCGYTTTKKTQRLVHTEDSERNLIENFFYSLLYNSSCQVYSDKNSPCHLILDGYLTNRYVINETLQSKGIDARNYSDVEAIFHLYKISPELLTSSLDGNYTITIIDEALSKISIIRDAIGQRPIFYSYKDRDFIFSNSLREINKIKKGSESINLEAANHFLAIGYVLQPLTIYDDIFQVEAGQIIEYNWRNETLNKRKYFSLENLFIENNSIDIHSAIEQFHDIIEKTFSQFSNKFTQPAVALSGGLDSSIIAFFQENNQPNKSDYFSFAFSSKNYNEFPKAEIVAKHLDVSLHKVSSPPNIQDVINSFITETDYFPADNAIFPLYLLAQEAKRLSNDYLITGDGADELFGGYVTHQADWMNQYLFFLSILKKSNWLNSWRNTNNKLGWRTKLTRFIDGADRNYQKAHYQWRLILNQEERVSILGENNKELIYDTDPFYQFKKHYEKVAHLTHKNQHLYVDMKTWLTDNILYKTHIATQKADIIPLSPFLNLDLVRFASSLPLKFKKNKLLLKKAMINKLPNNIIHQKKQGFNASIGEWMNIDTNEYAWLTKHLHKHYEQSIHCHTSF